MTPIEPISDEQLAELEAFCATPMFKDDDNSPQTMGELRGLIARLRAVEVNAGRWCRCKRMPRTWWLEAVDEASRKGGRSLDDAIDAAMERTP